jgi:(S)-2-hydroxy-acid oxidase
MKLKIHEKHKDNIKLKISNYKEAVNIYQIEDLANQTFNTNTYSYYSSGSFNMQSMVENVTDFETIKLLPKILVDVSSVDPSTELLGEKISIPVCFAPTALHKLCHPNGEVETALAANEVESLLCLSSISSVSLTKVAPNAKRKWMQLYIMKDLKKTELFIKMVERSGYTALVVTVDAPAMGIRDIENIYKFKGPEKETSENHDATNTSKGKKKVESGMGEFFSSTFNDVSRIIYYYTRHSIGILYLGLEVLLK